MDQQNLISKQSHQGSNDKNNDQEVDWLVGGGEEDRVSLGVVGKIWIERHVNLNATITTMKRIWNPRHGMEANGIKKNIFFLQFHHWKNKEHVLESQLWHFDRHMLMPSDINNECKPYEIYKLIAKFV